MKLRHGLDDTRMLSRVGGRASAPPPLPGDELHAMANTLREYGTAYTLAAEGNPAWAEAYSISDHLHDAARRIDAAVDYFGPYQRAPWEGEHR